MDNFFRTGLLIAALTALFMAVGFMLGGGRGMVFAFIFAGAMNFMAYWSADSVVLRMYGAREVDAAQVPALARLVNDLAGRAHIPPPRLYVIESDQPNAFATGRNPDHAALAVTTGLLRALPEQEIAGVLAHEIAHVKNRDTLTMTLTATIAGAIGMLANWVFFLSPGRQGDRGHPLGLVASLLVMFLAPLAATRGHSRPIRHFAHAGIRGGRGGGPHPRPADLARRRLGADRQRRAPDPQFRCREQSGHGASLHYQPVERRASRCPVLDPPACRRKDSPAQSHGRAEALGMRYAPTLRSGTAHQPAARCVCGRTLSRA